MNQFIAKSPSSQKILSIAQMALNLPVNVLIIGEVGNGKQLLAQQMLPNASIFNAKTLEDSMINKTINIEQYSELIILNLESVLNKKEFLENLTDIRIIATSSYLLSDIEAKFAIKIDILPLKQRPEDLDELIKIYTSEAKEIYDIKENIKNIDIDLSQNGVSLKKSIYKNILIRSLCEEDMVQSIEYFILDQLKQNKDYKQLLKFFEIPLLKAAKKEYKSQLQMANKLNINRITLRKKLDQYFGENNE